MTRLLLADCSPPSPLLGRQDTGRRRPGSVVRHLLDHRIRSRDERAGGRGPIARVRGRRRGAVRETRCRRGGDAGVGQSPVRSEGHRAAGAGPLAGRSDQAHHRRRPRPRHPPGRRDRHQGPLRRLHRQARDRSQFGSERPGAPRRLRRTCQRARISPRRATRWPAGRWSRRWPPRTRTARARWPRSSWTRSTPASRRAAIPAACSRPAFSWCGRCRPTRKTPSNASSTFASMIPTSRSRNCGGC